MFIINLAIFDLCMTLDMLMLLFNSFHQRIMGGEAACITYAAFGSFSGIGGATTNAVIAYDRFKTIASPLDGKLSKCQASFFIFLTWAWTIPFTILPALKIWGRFIPEGYLTFLLVDNS